jgi:hypothetical protein
VRDAWRGARAIEDRHTGAQRAFAHLRRCWPLRGFVLDNRNLQASGKTMQFP